MQRMWVCKLQSIGITALKEFDWYIGDGLAGWDSKQGNGKAYKNKKITI